jgi:beta-glucosidase
MHELYLWPFQEAVYAGSGNIMCSYNRINNSYASQNSKALNGILKTEIGFQGFVVSDWFAQHSGVDSAIGGLDMAMPDDEGFWGQNLSLAVSNGSLPEWRLDDMVTRILAAWYQMGQDTGFPEPGVGMPSNLLAPHQAVDARNPASKPIIFQSAVEGHVLVKNVNNALPFNKPKLLSIYGYDAKPPETYTPTSGIDPWALGAETMNASQILCAFEAGVGCGTLPPYSDGTLWSGGGSGSTTPPYISSPYDALLQYSIQNDIALFWDFATINSTSGVDGATDACLVFINGFATEGFDRISLRDDFSDALVNNIASQCSNTIVVVHSAGIRLVDQWIDHTNVTAVLLAHLPGQDSGRALVDLLFGIQSPSGKLPYTLAKNESDYGALLAPDFPKGEYENFPQSDFTEGVYIDYRYFDKNDIEPRYEFGYGLSYTTFEYSSLNSSIYWSGYGDFPLYPNGEIVPGGPEDLYDIVASVQANVKNTGSTVGAEVAQLYVGLPGSNQPIKQLRGFEKVVIQPGQTVTVTFDLRRRDLSVWDVNAQKWALQNGTYNLFVGTSSRNLPLTGTLSR